MPVLTDIFYFRILLEQSGSGSRVKWFGQDGRLVALPDPVLKRPTRPPILEDSDIILEPETYFCPPFLAGQSASEDLAFGKFSGFSHCQLDVSHNFDLYKHDVPYEKGLFIPFCHKLLNTRH